MFGAFPLKRFNNVNFTFPNMNLIDARIRLDVLIFFSLFTQHLELFWEVRGHPRSLSPPDIPHRKVPDGTVPPARGQVWPATDGAAEHTSD